MCACAFAFRALRSYRVFVGQNADNVFFLSDVLARGRNKTLQVTTVHKVFMSLASILKQAVSLSELGSIFEEILSTESYAHLMKL